MNGDCLLDSNVVIDIFRGNPTTIARVKKIKMVLNGRLGFMGK